MLPADGHSGRCLMSDDRWPRLSVNVLLIDSHVSRTLRASLEPQSGSHEALHFHFRLKTLVVDEPEYRGCVGGLAGTFLNLGSGHKEGLGLRSSGISQSQADARCLMSVRRSCRQV